MKAENKSRIDKYADIELTSLSRPLNKKHIDGTAVFLRNIVFAAKTKYYPNC